MRAFTKLIPLLLAGVIGSAAAQTKPVQLVVGSPPGGGNDTVARAVATRMNLGVPVVVENKPGAASMMAAQSVARAPADGSVLLLVSQSVLSVSPRLQQKKSIDPLRDFVPVAMIGKAPLVLVAGPALAAKTVPEIIAIAKAKPSSIDFGSGGIGTSPHMAGVMFGQATGTKLSHVPYAGEQAAITDVIGGRVPMMFANAPTALMHIRSGKVRGIAVTSGARVDFAPDLPTVSESGVPGFDAGTWLGLVAPKGTPPATVDRLNAEVRRVLALPEVRHQLRSQGYELADMSPFQFGQYIAAEDEKWGKVIRDGSIKGE
ncbi:tripartite-type tricarboxylate transporter receptor subunit TctC [Variovorax paradoxus]|uniref:tripartite tricarboxylate transporter substrate binding protein n=1 Tax=Variovorax paradoxus TaxID=34073 RepID=UPI00278815E5|nr:tripartite tricarboxylate transporter substrate binding protein [Variovorax paradoxus]MDP9962886.1 tripartite-type tricarboxylate transporter receptor subunit TctC [Variovorax paradoxus]